MKQDDKMKTNVRKRKNAPPRSCFPGALDGIPLHTEDTTEKEGKRYENQKR